MLILISMGLFTRKPLSASCQQSATHSTKNLSWFHLLAYGISATIGSGIYVTIGVTAKSITGPAVILSILLAGALSSLTALCYLELSNIVPASGSSYSWGVTFLGEGLGWLLGWISTLEYAFAGSCTAVAISQYISTLSPYLSPIPLAQSFTSPDTYLLVFNFVALLIIVLVSPVVLLGISFRHQCQQFNGHGKYYGSGVHRGNWMLLCRSCKLDSFFSNWSFRKRRGYHSFGKRTGGLWSLDYDLFFSGL